MRSVLSRLQAGNVASGSPLSVPPNAPLKKIVTTISRFKIGSVLVQERGESTVDGIATERDVMRKVDPGAANLTARDIMTDDIIVGSGRWMLDKCLQVMLDGNYRHLPVLRMGGKVDGVLSMRDVCRAFVEHRDAAAAAGPMTLADVIQLSADRHAAFSSAWSPFIAAAAYDGTVADAVDAMRASGTGSVVVPVPDDADASGTFGIFTERDLVQALAKDVAGAWAAPVTEHMTAASELVWAEPDLPVVEALKLLCQRGIRHLPVASSQNASATTAQPPQLMAVLSMREILAVALEKS